MPPSLVAQLAQGSPNGNPFTSAPLDTTGADFLVAMVTHFAGGSTGFSDNKGNTWSPRTTYEVANQVRIRLFYAASPIVGTGHTFTPSLFSTFNPSISVTAWSGITSTPYDTENGTATSGIVTSAQPGSVTPPANNELLVTAIGFQGSVTNVSINAGFTIVHEVSFSSGQHFGLAMGYLVQTTAAAINPTWSWTTSQRIATTIAGFRAIVTASDQRWPFYQHPYRSWRR